MVIGIFHFTTYSQPVRGGILVFVIHFVGRAILRLQIAMLVFHFQMSRVHTLTHGLSLFHCNFVSFPVLSAYLSHALGADRLTEWLYTKQKKEVK